MTDQCSSENSGNGKMLPSMAWHVKGTLLQDHGSAAWFRNVSEGTPEKNPRGKPLTGRPVWLKCMAPRNGTCKMDCWYAKAGLIKNMATWLPGNIYDDFDLTVEFKRGSRWEFGRYLFVVRRNRERLASGSSLKNAYRWYTSPRKRLARSDTEGKITSSKDWKMMRIRR